MKIDVLNPITADPHLNGESLCAVICRVKAVDGKLTITLGDHVHYHAEANGNGRLILRNTGPVPVKARAAK